MSVLSSLVRRNKGTPTLGIDLASMIRKFLYQVECDVHSGKKDKHWLQVQLLEFYQDHITEVLRQYKKETSRHRNTKEFHPSSLAGCPRAIWLDHMGAKGVAPFSADDAMRTFLIFSLGDMIHLRWQGLLHVMGILEQAEVAIEIPEYNIVGHTDGILNIAGKRYMLEIKSINSHGFDTLKCVKPDHKAQINVYLEGKGMKEAVVLYENKDRGAIKTYNIKFDPVLSDSLHAHVRKIQKHLQSGKSPDKAGVDPTASECKWCGYTRLCHSNEAMEKFMQSIKGVKYEVKARSKIAGPVNTQQGNAKSKQLGGHTALRAFLR